MITINGTQYRNLEEQVQKNKEDIANHYNIDRVLADFGIRVVGQVANYTLLPDPATYTGQYGDAYAVGSIAPYAFYIWTRADVDAGYPSDYWFNIGNLAIIGPRGPQGPEGPEGPTGHGSKWYTASQDPNSVITGETDGDMCLISTSNNASLIGNVYRWSEEEDKWILSGNIKGAQGIQGPIGPQGPIGEQGPQGIPGPKGDTGGLINIWGVVPTIDSLPNPSTLGNTTVAYLVGTTTPYTLYIQVGTDSSTATWVSQGAFNTGTAVNVDGQYVPVFDADTKLDKMTTATLYNRVYGKTPAGTQTTYNVNVNPVSSGIPMYSSAYTLKTETPVADNDTANKKYVDDSITTVSNNTAATYVKKATPAVSGSLRLYAQDDGGTETMIKATNAAVKGSQIVRRDATGHFNILEPENDIHPATKKYVDNAVAAVSGGGSTIHLYRNIYEISGSTSEFNTSNLTIIFLGSSEGISSYTELIDQLYVDKLYPASGELTLANEGTTEIVSAMLYDSTAIRVLTVNGGWYEVNESLTVTCHPTQIL